MENIEKITLENLPPVGGLLYRHANADKSTMYTRGKAGQREIGNESVSHLPYTLGIDPAGNCCQVPISTNRDPGEFDDRYEKITRRIAKIDGWIMLDLADKESVEVTTDAQGNRHARVIDKKILAEVVDRRNRANAAAFREKDKYQGEVDRMIQVFKAATGGAPGTNEAAMRAAGAKPRRPAGDEA